jgi:glycogen(starch) synthase
MRVVLFSSAFAPAVGGVEELTRRLAEHLIGAGDTVEVWTSRHPPSLPEDEVISGIRVRRFALPLPRMSSRELARFPLAATTAIVTLCRAAAKARPDLLHVQCFSANGVYATALSALIRRPMIVSLQGETVMDDHDIYDESVTLRGGLRLGLRRAAGVTACSRFVLDDAERRFGLREHVGTVVPNGVDLEHHDRPVAIDLPAGRFVLALGRVVEKKGFDLLLDAFSRLAAVYPDVGLVIGGNGDARPALIEKVVALGLSERVVLPGTLGRGQVAWAMQNASIFVLPSRVEPFGIVVLEALRAGRPVVVSSRGGAGEIVNHDRDGLVVDPFDVGSLASAIARLLSDDQLSRRLGAAGALCVERFAWPRIAAQYRDIYHDVATGALP